MCRLKGMERRSDDGPSARVPESEEAFWGHARDFCSSGVRAVLLTALPTSTRRLRYARRKGEQSVHGAHTITMSSLVDTSPSFFSAFFATAVALLVGRLAPALPPCAVGLTSGGGGNSQ